MADDDKPKKAPAKPVAAKPKPLPADLAKPVGGKPVATMAKPAAPAPTKPIDDDDDDVSAYGVVKESEEEEKLAQKNKPTFGAVRDKFKRSARGPAAALMVMPSTLLLGQGVLTSLIGLAMLIIGLWPLIFTDAPPSDEEVADTMQYILFGIVAFFWGGIVCYGSYQMSTLGSYPWAFVGAVFGLLPLLAGIFSIITLKDPRVVAGYIEPEAGPNQISEDDAVKKLAGDKVEEADDEEEDEEEEEEEKPKKKRKKK